MNLNQFAYYYRESLITLIYESCMQKQKLFSKITELAQSIYNKSQIQCTDGSIEDQLNSLKLLLQYSNQDISSHIDLALQQMKIAKRIQMRITPQIIQQSDNDDDDNEGNDVSDCNNDNDFNDDNDEGNDDSNDANGDSKDDDDSYKQSSQSEEESIEIENEVIKPIGNANKQFQNTLVKQSNQISKQLSQNSVQQVSKTQKQSSEVSDDSSDSDSFKQYLLDLDRIEEDHDLKATPIFRNKIFYLSHFKKNSSVLKKFEFQDKKYVYDLSKILETQKKTAQILKINKRIICRIVNSYQNDLNQNKYLLQKSKKNIPQYDKQSINSNKKSNLKINENNDDECDLNNDNDNDDENNDDDDKDVGNNEEEDEEEENYINNDLSQSQTSQTYKQAKDQEISNAQNQSQSTQATDNSQQKKVRFSDYSSSHTSMNMGKQEENEGEEEEEKSGDKSQINQSSVIVKQIYTEKIENELIHVKVEDSAMQVEETQNPKTQSIQEKTFKKPHSNGGSRKVTKRTAKDKIQQAKEQPQCSQSSPQQNSSKSKKQSKPEVQKSQQQNKQQAQKQSAVSNQKKKQTTPKLKK